jgi:flagellar protein FlbD
MIKITDLQGKEHYVNAELIELVESTPDTQIVLTTGHRIFTRESPTEIAELVLAYRRACARRPTCEPNPERPPQNDEE